MRAPVRGADPRPASTKRAKLIAMLERPEGASVAEIGQGLGWLPHLQGGLVAIGC